nr:hypothetical protein 12 [Bacillales bacterium]
MEPLRDERKVQNQRVVPKPRLHTNAVEGDERMDQSKVEPKTFEFGNTKVVIHSRLAHMNKEEQKAWYQDQWKKKNPVLREIATQIIRCQQD